MAGPPSFRPRVLCVDDEPLLLEGMQLTLRRGFEVVTASGGAEALRVLAEGPPFTVVVSDFQMPGMDGAELLSRIRERAPDTVRILLTGHASLEGAIRAVNSARLFRFLTKPCPPAELLGALDDAVEQARLITADRELLEARLEVMTGQLLQAERLATLGTLAGAIGHELNNVLTPFSGALDFISDRARDGLVPEAEDLKTLDWVRSHLTAHAKQLLHLGRPARPSGESTDLAEVVGATVSMLRSAGIFRRVEVQLDLPAQPLAVRLDRIRAEQVLVNLIKNAVDATADSKPQRLAVRVSREAGIALCRIGDSGCGIPKDKLAAVFEPYYTTKPPDRGTGLGLFVVKQIVEAAGGVISVQSEVGRGTVFEMRLPVG